MRTLAIVNQKGGCGKTTTAVNLAALLAAQGNATLLVDMDPQSHCAAALSVPEAQIEYAIEEALLRGPTVDHSALLWQTTKNLWLAPSSAALSRLESGSGGLMAAPDRDRRLSALLDQFAPRFKWCIIDCPPTIGLLTFNAIRAADEALIPVETGFLAMKGAHRQVSTIRSAIARMERNVAVRILPTMHRRESRLASGILTTLQRDFGPMVIPLAIHIHETLRESVALGQPITEHAPASDACEDFRQLVRWLEQNPVEIQRRPDAPLIEVIRSGDAASSSLGEEPHSLDQPVNSRAREMAERLRTQAAGEP
ncbi:MAG: ParA family protein [Phycisphaerales bacterium]|nr:ParA family protein [Phycisphaerales bacterium]